METMENTVIPKETELEDDVDSGEDGAPHEGDRTPRVKSGDVGNADAESDSSEEEETLFEDVEAEIDEEAELSELRRISGMEYGSLSEFSGYKRYLELKKSGVLTAEEAFYAVNRDKKTMSSAFDGAYSANASYSSDSAAVSGGSKRHMSASVRKPSSGEVFTRADREELAKWGISATGSELERLWREAGK